MTNATITADRLLQSGAVKLNLQQPYTWASGWKSPIYCDNRQLLSFPEIRTFIKNELARMVGTVYPSSSVIAGVATAGIPWGALVADVLELPFVYVRPKPKEHGMGNQIEGFLKQGASTVVVEDLISTGKSSLQVVDVLRRAGADIIGMASIFSYGFDAARQAFLAEKVNFTSLTTYPVLVNLAREQGKFSVEQEQILLNWSADPVAWVGIN